MYSYKELYFNYLAWVASNRNIIEVTISDMEAYIEKGLSFIDGMNAMAIT